MIDFAIHKNLTQSLLSVSILVRIYSCLIFDVKNFEDKVLQISISIFKTKTGSQKCLTHL